MKTQNPTLKQLITMGLSLLTATGLAGASARYCFNELEKQKQEGIVARAETERREQERKEHSRKLEEDLKTEWEAYRLESEKQKNEGSISTNPQKLLSNEFFTNETYLTKEEITRFLKKKNSCLQKTGIEELIMSAAKKHKVNPLILLARTQVEKGLVTKQSATNSELQYATGYGAFDKGEWLPSNGIANQIQSTAECLRNHYDSFEGKSMKIDGGKREITPQNRATYALLKYTPWTNGATLNAKVICQYSREIKK